MSIINVDPKTPYNDSPTPKLFGTVSPIDPQLFLTINDFAVELLIGERSGKYNPVEVAHWLSNDAAAAEAGLQQAALQSTNKANAAYRRVAVDVSMQIGLGRFFADKFRAGVLYDIYKQTSDRTALEQAVKHYQQAREYWATLANLAKGVYQKDVTAGEYSFLRGHWLDRLPAIDEDVSVMRTKLENTKANTGNRPANIVNAVNECIGKPRRLSIACRHTQPSAFAPGNAVDLTIAFDKAPAQAKLIYRHVNNGERYEVMDMKAKGNHYSATIAAAYTQSPYPLEYYFELRESPELVTLYPGFNAERTNQPYFVIRQSHSA
jgi:hypothetical protein